MPAADKPRKICLRACAQLVALFAVFHQVFLDFGPSVIAPAPVLFRLIQLSLVSTLFSFVICSLRSEYLDEQDFTTIAGASILTFLIASLIGWVIHEEVSRLLSFRIAFVILPKAACLLIILKLVGKVFASTVEDLTEYLDL